MSVEVKKRERKEKRETKSKEVESKCKKISQFFPNVNEQLADPTSIKSLSYNNLAVEAMNLESTAEQTFDTALRTESEKKGVNDVNESMQLKTIAIIQLCWKTLMMISIHSSLKTD